MVPTANVLFYFESRVYKRKLWISISIKTNFVKIRAFKRCSFLLDGFPLYWFPTPHPQGARSLNELDEVERKNCLFLEKLGVMFNRTTLIKLEFQALELKAYSSIDIFSLSVILYLKFCDSTVYYFLDR